MEASLKALKMDAVDLFYLHSPDINVPIMETLTACNEMYKQGKFKTFGLSNYAAWDVVRIYFLCKENKFCLPSVYQ